MQAGGNMETLKARLRDVVARQGRRVSRIAGVDDEIRGLHDRITELEREVAESRRLNQRLAELTEVLVPAADRDDKKLAELLTKYNRESF
jgi:hypothetical protein